MRMLLMIGNQQMSLRERYTAILDAHPDGWLTSFMSGMPGDVVSTASGYAAVIFELGPPDGEERIAQVRTLLDAGIIVVTHLEGRIAFQGTTALQAAGAIVIPAPVTAAGIREALDLLAARIKKQKHDTPRLTLRRFLRRWIRGV